MTPPGVDIRPLLEAATPRPWFADDDHGWSIQVDRTQPIGVHEDTTIADLGYADRPESPANAALIVAAVNSLPHLLDERKDLREALQRIRNKTNWRKTPVEIAVNDLAVAALSALDEQEGK